MHLNKLFFRSSRVTYRYGKVLYSFILDVRGYKPKINKETIDGPAAIIRINADFSEIGFNLVRKLMDEYSLQPIIAVKMQDVIENPKNLNMAKELEKKGAHLAVHGYHHGAILPLMTKRKKEEEIKKAFETFKQLFNKKPIAFFSSRNAYDKYSLELLAKYGFKYYSECNLLFPQKHGLMWDLTLNRKFFDPKDSDWQDIADYIITRKGVISTCWHMCDISDANISNYKTFLNYLLRKNVKFINMAYIRRHLK